MGIEVEFNTDLALRNTTEFREGRRKKEECIPEKLKEGDVFEFLKEGQRNYWMHGEFPLRETEGNQKLSRPLASVVAEEITHVVIDGKVYTRGKCRIVRLLDPDGSKIYFEGFEKV